MTTAMIRTQTRLLNHKMTAAKGLLLATVALFITTSAVTQWPQPASGASFPGLSLATELANGALSSFLLPAPVDKYLDSEMYQSNGKVDPDTHRNVIELIKSRDFHAEQHDVTTTDGYIISIQRIVNPLVAQDYRPKMKPVILQHGLFSSAADWVINSVDVRPRAYPPAPSKQSRSKYQSNGVHDDAADFEDDDQDPLKSSADSDGQDSQQHPNSLGFYLANEGYDVWLSTIRGNTYAMRHTNISSWDPLFWTFSFDEHISHDLPAVIAYIQGVTNHTKVGYVGHSQGTLMGFGLLADKPEYADIIEPFVALAPVAYVDNAISPARYFAVYTPIAQHINMWFMTSNIAIKTLMPIVCGPHVVRKDVCSNILFLSTGFDMDELDIDRLSAYVSHSPAGTSIRNIAHYGQEIYSKRFAHYDYGKAGNMMKYGNTKNPDYDLSKIRSTSIALFTAENDWLASPKDVARLKAALKVQPHLVFNTTTISPKWNHIDFVYGKSCGELINSRVLKVFNDFRHD